MNVADWNKHRYQWTGVANPNRLWWQFWKPKKANILITFHYQGEDIKLGPIHLEIKYG